jgi:hypothetical protein
MERGRRVDTAATDTQVPTHYLNAGSYSFFAAEGQIDQCQQEVPTMSRKEMALITGVEPSRT